MFVAYLFSWLDGGSERLSLPRDRCWAAGSRAGQCAALGDRRRAAVIAGWTTLRSRRPVMGCRDRGLDHVSAWATGDGLRGSRAGPRGAPGDDDGLGTVTAGPLVTGDGLQGITAVLSGALDVRKLGREHQGQSPATAAAVPPSTNSCTSGPQYWQIFNTKEFCTSKDDDRVQFLDKSLHYKMEMIKIAIKKDQMSPITPSVNYTSSAADTISIFLQIKEETFKYINLQDLGEDTKLIALIIDRFCICCILYAEEIFKKIWADIDFERRIYKISKQWCYGINSASFISSWIDRFVNDMKLDVIKASSRRTELWKSNLQNTTENAKEKIECIISFQLEMAAKKMMPTVKERLLESFSNTQSDHQNITEYLASNFLIGTKLLESKNFDLLLCNCWSSIITIVPICINESKKLVSMQNIHKITQGLKDFMSTNDERQVLELDAIDKLFKLEAQTNDYIHQYYLSRLNFQKSLTNHSFGSVSVKAHISKNNLVLEILSVRNIVPSEKTSTSKSYIKIKILPKHKFKDIREIKTRPHKTSTCFTIDKKYSVPLSPEQYLIKDALLQFTLKKIYRLKTKKKFVAEAFLLFSDISRCHSSNCSCKMDQIHLLLTRPTSLQCYPCYILKQISDEEAKTFLKKENEKINL